MKTYVTAPPKAVYCPLCQELFKSPVLSSLCSHTFCKSCVEQNVKSCPICSSPLTLDNTFDNLAIQNVILELLVYCKNYNEGCREVLQNSNSNLHEDKCLFTPVCCNWKNNGCQWKGILKNLNHHLNSSCPFESIKFYIMQTSTQIEDLKKLVEYQQEKIDHLAKNGTTATTTVSTQTTASNSDEPLPSSRTSSSSSANTPQWNLDDLRCIYTLADHNRGVTSLGFASIPCESKESSPSSSSSTTSNQSLLFSGSHDTSIKIWDVSGVTSTHLVNEGLPDIECLGTLSGHRLSVWSLLFCPQSSLLYSGSSDTTIRIWKPQVDESSQKLSFTFQNQIKTTNCKIYTMMLDSPSNRIYAAGSDGEIKILSTETHESLGSLKGHQDTIWKIDIKCDILASCGEDKLLKLWDIKSGKVTQEIKYEKSVLSLGLSENAENVYFGSQNCKIGVWNIRAGKLEREMIGHTWEVWQVIVKGDVCATGSFDHTIKLWGNGGSLNNRPGSSNSNNNSNSGREGEQQPNSSTRVSKDVDWAQGLYSRFEGHQ